MPYNMIEKTIRSIYFWKPIKTKITKKYLTFYGTFKEAIFLYLLAMRLAFFMQKFIYFIFTNEHDSGDLPYFFNIKVK